MFFLSVKKSIYYLIALAIILIVVIFFVYNKGDNLEYTTAIAAKGNLVQTVSETGTVKSAREINLNFLATGKIANLAVVIGQEVAKDQVLAELDYSGLSIKAREAESNLAVARANLAKVLVGATTQEIAVSEASVNQARTAYEAAIAELEKTENLIEENIAQAQKTLNDLESSDPGNITPEEQAVATAEKDLANTINTYQQTINNKKDLALVTTEDKLTVAEVALATIYRTVNDEEAKDTLSTKNITYLNDTNNSYSAGQSLLIEAKNSLALAKTSKTENNINKALDDAVAALNKTFDSLNFCYRALENTLTTSSFTQTELDTLKTSISTQLTNVSAAISAVKTAEQNLADAILTYDSKVASAGNTLATAKTALANAILNASNSLGTAKISGAQQLTAVQAKIDNNYKAWQLAQARLNEVKAPARSQDIALYQAQVNQAQAALDAANNQINDSIIKAPINGVITKLDYEIGEQVAANNTVIAMLGENNFEIEVLISEADVAKVKVGDPADITLDAFGDELELTGQVAFIEPAETIVQDVTYYKIKVIFSEDSTYRDYIKSGMTANIIIITATRENVLTMPTRAIIEKNGQGRFTRIYQGGQVAEVPVTIGLRGDDGMVEVLSGVEEGDEVVTHVNEKN